VPEASGAGAGPPTAGESPDSKRTSTPTIADRERVVAEMEVRQHTLLERSRRLLGAPGEDADIGDFRDGLRTGAGLRTVLVLSLFGALIQASVYLVTIVGPEMGHGMGLSASVVALILAQQNQGIILGSAQLSAASYRRAERRRRMIIGLTLTAGLVLVESAFITQPVILALDLGALGASLGSVYALQRPMLIDAYPPQVRVRAMSVLAASTALGAFLAFLTFALCERILDLTWRGSFVVFGAIIIVVSLVAGRALRPALPGRFDTDPIRSAVRAEVDSPLPPGQGDEPRLGFGEVLRRVWATPGVRMLLVAWAVIGVVVTSLVSYQGTFLQEHFHLDTAWRAGYLAISWAFAFPALAWFGRRGEKAYARRPGALVRMGMGAMITLGVALLVAVLAQQEVVSLIGFGVAFGASACVVPILTVPMLSVVRPYLRAATAAIAAFFLAGVGAELGSFVLSGIQSRFSTGAAIGFMAVPALLGALVLRAAAAPVSGDLDTLANEIVEEEEVADIVGRGGALPLLSCRHIDFSYGSLQVLFDVNLAVDDGEMVALLGTNGAGKSTLLRVISGLGLPSRGSVTFGGEDLTFWDAERRVARGLVQVPGGRAVFAPLSVVENLRVFGYTHGRDRRSVDAGIERTFEVFPQLGVLRNNLAATLSGGEQQMLGLARSFLLEPRLLLIDELSLGLAPRIVGELLEIVQQINAQGTAVVLVEQSVNIALSVVNRAYFMERGEITFEGPARDLLDRPDLLRAVMLEGAARRMAGAESGS
jgi:ABC-type branched-subunit amino acid transport system ATPase component